MLVLCIAVLTLFTSAQKTHLGDNLASPNSSLPHHAGLMAKGHKKTRAVVQLSASGTLRTRAAELLPWTTDGVVNIPGTDMPLLPNTKFIYAGEQSRYEDRYSQSSSGLEAFVECARYQTERGHTHMVIAIDGGWHNPAISQCYGYDQLLPCTRGCTNPMYNYAMYALIAGVMSGGGNECTCSDGTAATGDACSADGAEICESCNKGNYLSGTICVACPADTYSNTDGNTQDSCTAKSTCPVGIGLTAEGDAMTDLTCTECTSGKFSDADDRTPCRAHGTCAVGQGKVTPGSTSVDTQCHECVGDTYSNSDSTDVCHSVAGISSIVRASSSTVKCATGYHGTVTYGSDGAYADGCEENVCTCEHGVGATKEECPANDAVACTSCSGSYVLRNSECTQLKFPCGDTCAEVTAGQKFSSDGCYFQNSNATEILVVKQGTKASDIGFFCAKVE